MPDRTESIMPHIVASMKKNQKNYRINILKLVVNKYVSVENQKCFYFLKYPSRLFLTSLIA